MKLIDLLVKELPKLGGWPEGVTHIGQEYDRELMFYGRENISTGLILNELAIDHRKLGKSGEKITRAQYEAALAASKDVVGHNGWIEWHGGECPVDSDAIVEVKFRNPNPYQFNNDRAGDFYWSHDDLGYDIIAYRLHDQGINNRTNDDQLEQDLNDCIGQDVGAPEWSGEGLPPVGTVCMANLANGWTDVKVAYIGDEGGCREALVFEIESTEPAWADEFRPLRTEEEKAREKLASSLHIAAGASPIELNGIGRLYFKLADAIISGSVFGTTFKAGK